MRIGLLPIAQLLTGQLPVLQLVKQAIYRKCAISMEIKLKEIIRLGLMFLFAAGPVLQLAVLSGGVAYADGPGEEDTPAINADSTKDEVQNELRRLIEKRFGPGKAAGKQAADKPRQIPDVSATNTRNTPGKGPGDKEVSVGKERGITLNFERTEIREVVKTVLGDILGLNYVIDPKVTGQVTLQTSQPFQKDALLSVLQSVLRMNGAALIKVDGLYRVVPGAAAAGSVLAPGFGSPSGPGYQTLVVPLKYMPASQMKGILEPIVPKGMVFQVKSSSNLLLLSGSREELTGILETISIFDVDALSKKSVALIPLEYTSAATLATELENILGEELGDPLPEVLRLIPIVRMNAILVITQQPKYLKYVRDWVTRLDESVDSSELRVYVYEVQNSSAEHLAVVLGDLFGASGSVQDAGGQQQVAPGYEPITMESKTAFRDVAANQQAISRPSTSADGPGRQVRDFDVSVGGVHILADTERNSLVIRATAADYRRIRSALDALDTIPLQVHIEASIVEVSLSGQLKYGIQWFFKNNSGGYDGEGLLDLDGDPLLSAVIPGFSYSVIGPDDVVRAVLNALAGDSRLKVISSPSLMVLDNHTAQIRIGDQQPVLTGSSQSDGGVITESIEYKDTGVMLEVTPRVNAGGLVIMDVVQEVTDVGEIDEATGQRSFLQRNVNSVVAVQSGETVIMGGLIRDNKSSSNAGIPILRSLPILGNLFSATSKVDDRTELMVLITPTSVRGVEQARELTEEFRKKLDSLYMVDF